MSLHFPRSPWVSCFTVMTSSLDDLIEWFWHSPLSTGTKTRRQPFLLGYSVFTSCGKWTRKYFRVHDMILIPKIMFDINLHSDVMQFLKIFYIICIPIQHDVHFINFICIILLVCVVIYSRYQITRIVLFHKYVKLEFNLPKPASLKEEYLSCVFKSINGLSTFQWVKH